MSSTFYATGNMKAYTRFRIFAYKKYDCYSFEMFQLSKTVTVNAYSATLQLRSRRKMVGEGTDGRTRDWEVSYA